MPIAKITGKFRKTIIRDISFGIGSGLILGYVFWEFEHKPKFAKIDAYYKNLAEQGPNAKQPEL
ncbi:cytochrome c oxidase subunit 7A precursor [Gonapodya prolifera JEL478]|uniref:Cytochrome c oxidase subunit 7A n=1 Tax=Gonapodya prolifera (strain JEL478) TaxID=1344416 RepID=A0A139AW32_GONPJ|nr:cytochrome c oxidase subunit 7A precursor [Gonapodya prolifera JEL478]|eukprot:KXS20793.1 cytochrome c oxidase subunit 7A precursor [Gonapodya prolifera JEL478]